MVLSRTLVPAKIAVAGTGAFSFLKRRQKKEKEQMKLENYEVHLPITSEMLEEAMQQLRSRTKSDSES